MPEINDDVCFKLGTTSKKGENGQNNKSKKKTHNHLDPIMNVNEEIAAPAPCKQPAPTDYQRPNATTIKMIQQTATKGFHIKYSTNNSNLFIKEHDEKV